MRGSAPAPPPPTCSRVRQRTAHPSPPPMSSRHGCRKGSPSFPDRPVWITRVCDGKLGPMESEVQFLYTGQGPPVVPTRLADLELTRSRPITLLDTYYDT